MDESIASSLVFFFHFDQRKLVVGSELLSHAYGIDVRKAQFRVSRWAYRNDRLVNLSLTYKMIISLWNAYKTSSEGYMQLQCTVSS